MKFCSKMCQVGKWEISASGDTIVKWLVLNKNTLKLLHKNRNHCILKFCFQVEDVLWGWNNEVHIFDPMQASWSEPQTNVSQCDSCFYTLNAMQRFLLVIWETREVWQFWKSVKTISKFSDDFTVTVVVCRAVLQPPGPPTPVPQWDVEDTFVEAESWWELYMVFSSSHIFISRQQEVKSTDTQIRYTKQSLPLVTCAPLFLNAGNQDEWHSLPRLSIMEVVRNVRMGSVPKWLLFLTLSLIFKAA